MTSLRSLAIKSESQSALDSRRLSRELSELTATNAGRDPQNSDAAIIEDPTSVVALLNVAGRHWDVPYKAAWLAGCL